MKNKKGFTLIELLAVIVVLAIVMVLAATTVLPYMSNARENAFRVEATNVVASAENAKDLYVLGQLTLPTGSCANATKICFTVSNLISLSLYDSDESTFAGTVTISNYKTKTPTYTLNFKKSTEFAIVGGTGKDYSKYTGAINATFTAGTHDKCVCS